MNIELACKKYAEDVASNGGKVVHGKLNKFIDVELPWTSSTWGDGVPVTKNFRRCEDHQALKLDEGTKLIGVSYNGYNSGCQMFDFYINGTWYSSEQGVAEYILEALDQ